MEHHYIKTKHLQEEAENAQKELNFVKKFMLELPDLVDFLNGDLYPESLQECHQKWGEDFDKVLVHLYLKHTLLKTNYAINPEKKLNDIDAVKFRGTKLKDFEPIFYIQNENVRRVAIDSMVEFMNNILDYQNLTHDKHFNNNAMVIYDLLSDWFDEKLVENAHIEKFVKHYAGIVEGRALARAKVETKFQPELKFKELKYLTQMGLGGAYFDTKKIEDLILTTRKEKLSIRQFKGLQKLYANWAICSQQPNNDKFLDFLLHVPLELTNDNALKIVTQYDTTLNPALLNMAIIKRSLYHQSKLTTKFKKKLHLPSDNLLPEIDIEVVSKEEFDEKTHTQPRKPLLIEDFRQK